MKAVILGVGNVIQQDDGVGTKVIAFLEARYDFQEGVEIVDGGTVGLGLGHILANQDLLVVIDAVLMSGDPGTIHTLSGDQFKQVSASLKMSPHQVNFLDLISALEMEGTAPTIMKIVGVVPESTDTGTDLTPKVEESLPETVEKVLELLTEQGVEFSKKETPNKEDYWWERT